MKKIPTLFRRLPDGTIDWEDPVVDIVNAVPTVKYDGTCVMIRGGELFARRMVKPGKTPPPDFELVDTDENTGKQFGWVPVGYGPEWQWHREADKGQTDGTYELIGPKIQGNPLDSPEHVLIPHGRHPLDQDLNPWELMRLCEAIGFEGVVWWRDEPVAKLKVSDIEWM